MYASVQDLREEGVTEAQASDERLHTLLQEAMLAIHRHTGWVFEPRVLAIPLEGRGTATIEPPLPPIQIHSLRAGPASFSIHPDDLIIIGSPVQPDFIAPQLTCTRGFFPRVRIVATGVWGYTEPDGTPLGRTPLEIRRVCMLIALRWLAPLAQGDGDARQRWRIIEERTRDQSYRLDRPSQNSTFITGDPDIDDILYRYRRPPRLGAS